MAMISRGGRGGGGLRLVYMSRLGGKPGVPSTLAENTEVLIS